MSELLDIASPIVVEPPDDIDDGSVDDTITVSTLDEDPKVDEVPPESDDATSNVVKPKADTAITIDDPVESVDESGDPQYYDGDVVVRKLKPPPGGDYIPCFGTVQKPPRDGPESGKDASENLVNVRWETTNGVENVQPELMSLVDRFVMRNTKVENSQGVRGTVTNWNAMTTVQIIGTNHVVERVQLDRLRPITSVIRGQEILYNDWVGVITTVRRNIWFVLDSGMGFSVPVTENDNFVRTDPYWGVGMPCPGIRTKLTSAVMRKAKWTSGPMKFFSKILPPLRYLHSKKPVTLNKSEVAEVDVTWLTMVPSPDNPKAPKPRSTLNRDMLRNVTVIGMPSSETVGINSVRVLKVRPEDSLTTYSSWLDAFRKKHLEDDEHAEPTRSSIAMTAPLRVLASERVYEVPVKVLSRQTTLEVAWKDGSVEIINAAKIPKIRQCPEDKEFPNGLVVTSAYNRHSPKEYYGIVLDSENFVQTKSRKVNVMWILNGKLIGTQPEVVLDLKPHPIYTMYERGTIVFPRERGITPFKAAVVSDLNLMTGKMVVTITADHSLHEVYPHQVAPLSFRSNWNIFTRNWVGLEWNWNDITVPPYQLQIENGPGPGYVKVADPSHKVKSGSKVKPQRLDNADAD